MPLCSLTASLLFFFFPLSLRAVFAFLFWSRYYRPLSHYREHLREFPLNVIFNVVYHTPGTASSMPAEAVESSDVSMEIQMAWGGSATYTFQVRLDRDDCIFQQCVPVRNEYYPETVAPIAQRLSS